MLTVGHADKAGRDAPVRDTRPASDGLPNLRDRLRTAVKGAIVTAGCWRLLPESWTDWLIQRGGLADA